MADGDTGAAPPAPGGRGRWAARLVPHLRLLLVLGGGALGLLLVVRAVPALNEPLSQFPWDFGVDHATAGAYLDHESPFSREGAERLGLTAQFGVTATGHPPTTSFWALPLAHLSLRLANVVLASITVLLLLLMLLAIGGPLRWPAPLVIAWVAFAYVFSASFMSYHLSIGQLSVAIAFLYVVAWRALRRGDEILAGTALGLACSMKLFVMVVVLYLVAARRTRALIAAGASFLVVAGIMTARFGVGSWLYFFGSQKAVAAVWGPHIQNQSVLGVLSRLFFPACGPPWPVGAPGFWAATGATVASVALLVLAARWTWGTPREPDDWDVPFALFVVLSVITSKFAWEHYAVIYLLPVAVLVDRVLRAWRAREGRAVAAVMLGALATIVASWRINYYEKQRLQALVRQGRQEFHVEMHLYEIAAWLPGILLALMLFVFARRAWRRRQRESTSITVAARNTSET